MISGRTLFYSGARLSLWVPAQVYKALRRASSIVRDFPRINAKKAPFEPGWEQELEKIGFPAKLAFVSATPNGIVNFSLRNLLEGLAELGYSIVLTAGVKDKVTGLLPDGAKVAVLRRDFVCGRDFGVWKCLIKWLSSRSALANNLEGLVLVNDSLYYNNKSADLIRKLETNDYAWSCCFENYIPYYHAQSFLLWFGPEVITSEVFRGYWEEYKPYENRRHIIANGEILFSKTIAKTFGAPKCAYSGSSIVGAIADLPDEMWPRFLAAVKRNRLLAGRFLKYLDLHNGPAAKSMQKPTSTSNAETLYDSDLVLLLKSGAENLNSTHSIGLPLNICSGTPIKRDLVMASTHRVSDILDYAQGYTDSEMCEIRSDLLRKSAGQANAGLAATWQALCRE